MARKTALLVLLLISVAVISGCSKAETAYYKAYCAETNNGAGCDPGSWWDQSTNSATPLLQSYRQTLDYQKTVDDYERDLFDDGQNICDGNPDGWHPAFGNGNTGRSLWLDLAYAGVPDTASPGIPVPRCSSAARDDFDELPTIDLSTTPERNDQGWALGRSGQFSWSNSTDIRWIACSIWRRDRPDSNEVAYVGESGNCPNSYPVNNLPDGVYRFNFKVSDGYHWAEISDTVNVDLTPPTEPKIKSGPSGKLTVNKASVVWEGGSDSMSGFDGYKCALDDDSPASAEPCTGTSKDIAVTESGAHSFYVYAVDKAGNLSKPAVVAWTYLNPDDSGDDSGDSGDDASGAGDGLGESGSKMWIAGKQRPLARRAITMRLICVKSCAAAVNIDIDSAGISLNKRVKAAANKTKTFTLRLKSKQVKQLKKAMKGKSQLTASATADLALAGGDSDSIDLGFTVRR